LVATLEAAQRVAYLEKAFGWFFDRTRSTAVAVGGGAIALSVAVSSAVAGKGSLTTVIAVVIVVCFISAGVWINYVLAPLHREYLDCHALHGAIGHFEEELRTCLVSSRKTPESIVDVRWVRRTGRLGRNTVARATKNRINDWYVDPAEAPSEAIGRYLVENLAPVPTDQYERPQVRQVVDHCLDCALRAKTAANIATPTSHAWQEILVKKPSES